MEQIATATNTTVAVTDPTVAPTPSTLGKGQAPVPLPAGRPFDVLAWVATAHRQAGAAEATLTAAVTRARQAGASWTAIGAQLGVSRQGAQQRFTRASADESTKPATPHTDTSHQGTITLSDQVSRAK